MDLNIVSWNNKDVLDFLRTENISSDVINVCKQHEIDGQCLLSLEDRDFYDYPLNELTKLGARKKFMLLVKKLQKENRRAMVDLGLCDDYRIPSSLSIVGANISHVGFNMRRSTNEHNSEMIPSAAANNKASRLKPEIWKTAIALGK